MPAATLAPGPTLQFRPERPQDAVAAERLIAQAFGPGRFAKSVERLREGSEPVRDLSFIAWRGETPVGAVRLWSIRIGDTPALLLGPFAVSVDHRGQGLGAELIRTACDAATAAGAGIVLLVGDAAYFAGLGFVQVPLGQVVLPGPADPRRIHWRPLRPGATEAVSGAVTRGRAS